MSIMLKEKSYVGFEDLEKAFDRIRCVGIGNDEERNIRNFG